MHRNNSLHPPTAQGEESLIPARASLLHDGHGRRIRYARISITETCNYRCTFCMPSKAGKVKPRSPLTTAETLRIAAIFSRMGIERFKVTGGEPFVNPDAAAILSQLKTTCGAQNVTLTTNASTLHHHIAAVSRAGVDGVNISLNAITPKTYARVTGSRVDAARILDNILLAADLGLRVKLNMVPVRGLNDADIVPVLKFSLENGLPIRFIELMPLGEGRKFQGVPRDEIRRVIESRFGPLHSLPGLHGNGPATYFRLPGYSARIGFIAALSENFCASCNRIRLTHSGFLKTCLHHNHGGDLAGPLRDGEDDNVLAARIRAIVMNKPKRHDMTISPASGFAVGSGSVEAMHAIGG